MSTFSNGRPVYKPVTLGGIIIPFMLGALVAVFFPTWVRQGPLALSLVANMTALFSIERGMWEDGRPWFFAFIMGAFGLFVGLYIFV